MRILLRWSGTGAAYLVEDGQDAPAGAYAVRFSAGDGRHKPGCACCAGRSNAAEALGRIFRARATAAAPFFTELIVLASEAGQAAIHAALTEDLMARARFRV